MEGGVRRRYPEGERFQLEDSDLPEVRKCHADLPGEMKGMKESYEEELAIHVGPESCGPAREGRRTPKGRAGVEALTGKGIGRVARHESTST